ncbi:right-handed parallel beta-helix repeat-containing protein [Candidatus Saccharibacteria bacterium]|nr:right-handed parallel beta-helix repeat-containing protein [Candidatus Saccharibacteria bacterium]
MRSIAGVALILTLVSTAYLSFSGFGPFNKLTPTAYAATNNTLNFQARLQSNTGAIAPDGDYNVEFKIYDSLASGSSSQAVCSLDSSTDDCWWLETRTGANKVHVSNGYFTVNLGSVTAFGSNIPWDQQLYLTMNIGGTSSPSWDGEMTPRLTLTGVPYAFQAKQAEKLTQVQGSYTGTLDFDTLTGGDQNFVLQDQGSAGTYNLLTENMADANYIQNGTSQQASADFNIDGTGIADILQGTTRVQTPLVDTASAGTLSIGTATATAITIGDTGVTTTIAGALTVTEATTFNGNLTVATGNVAFQAGTNFSTTGQSDNVNFGTGAVFRLTGASAQTITGIAGGTNGRMITLINAAANDAIITNNDTANSDADKVIVTGTGADLNLSVGAAITLIYDSTDSIWRVIGGAADSAGAGGVTLQTGSPPGTPDTGNFNVSGTGITGTALLTPLLDTPSGTTTLNIGTNNATSGINLNQDVTIAANKDLTFASGTGNFDQSASSGTFATGTGAVSLNGDTTIGSGNTLDVQGDTTLSTTSTSALTIQDGSSNVLLTADTSNQRINIGTVGTSTGQLYVSGTIPSSTAGSVATGITTAQKVLVQGNYAYVIGNQSGTRLKVFDVSNPASPVALSGTFTDSNGNSSNEFVIGGNRAYVASGDRMVSINITNQNSPVSGGSTATISNGNGTGLGMSGHYVFTTSGSEIQSFDISTGAPVSVQSADILGGSATAIDVQGAYAYVGAASTVRVINIADPSSMSSASSVSYGSAVTDLKASGRYVYAISSAGNNLKIYDVKNPTSSPVLAGSLTLTTNCTPDAITVADRLAFVACSGTANIIEIVDVSDPTTPVSEGTISTGVAITDVHVAGRYLYAIDASSNLLVYDIGGTYTQSLEAGSANLGKVSVTGTSLFGGEASFRGGIQVAEGAYINGGIGVIGNSTITGNLSVSGTVTGTTLQASTSVLTPLVGRATSGTLSVGTDTNSTAVTISRAGITTTIAGALTVTQTTTFNDNVTVAAGKTLRLTGGNTASRPGSPTEGMLYYDTDTHQMLQYNGTKWVTNGSDAYLVAASNSSQADKDAADYIADGTADEVEINNALAAADPASAVSGARKSGKVYLFAGTYVAAATINIPNNTTLSGAGNGTVIELDNLDTTENLIENTDQTTSSPGGTGVAIQDLKLDGRNDLNTAGTQYGIYLKNMGSGTGSSAKQGAKVTNVDLTRFRTSAIYLDASVYGQYSNITIVGGGSSATAGYGFAMITGSYHNTLTNVSVQGVTGYGIYLNGASYSTLTGIIAKSISKNTGSPPAGNGSGLYMTGSNYVSVSNSIFRQNAGDAGLFNQGGDYGAFTGNVFYLNTYDGIFSSGNNTTITGNSANSMGTNGYEISGIYNTITGNTSVSSNSNGFLISGAFTSFVSNNARANSLAGVSVSAADDSNFTGNNISQNTLYGIQLSGSSDRVAIDSNRIANNGSTGTNNGIHITNSNYTHIVGNSISDTSATVDHAITIVSGTGNYLADNTLDSGDISDSGTSTVYGGQSNGTSYLLQPAQDITIGSGSTTTTIQGNTAVTLSGTTGTTMVCQNGSGYLSACDASYLTPTATNFIQNQNSSQQSGNYWISGTARADTSVLSPIVDTASAGTLSIGTTNATAVTISTGATVRATFANSNTLYLGLGATSAAPTAFTVSATGSSTSGTAGANLTLQGGNATVGNANGGNLLLSGGTGFGTGVNGLVVIGTPTFSTAATQSCGSNCNVTQSNIDGAGAVIVNATASSLTVTLSDPTNTTAGRVVYVTAANGSNDFTLAVNGGGSGNQIAMRQNTTATMIWNGSDWTAAGASSSTTLQAAYDNTLTSAGGAELVVSNGTNANGLTIRDSSSNPVNGTLLEVQGSAAANIFAINSNVTEYASNAGVESSISASDWVLLGSSTVTRNTTVSNVASGQGSAQVVTTTAASDGVKNVLSTSLTPSQHYNVSFTTKLSSGTFTDLAVYYSIDGSANSVTCATGQAVKTKIWTKINCAFTAPSSGITANNSINIRQVGSGTAHTFYIDNISVTIAADYNYATDGTVNDSGNFSTNWTAVGSSTVTRNTSDGQEASDSAQAAAGTTAGNGVKNKLSINPLTSTLYRVSVYAKLVSGSAFTDFTVRYTPNNGTNFVDCVDYNTQTVVTTGWTQITCYIDTAGTSVTNPYVHFVQTAAAGSARTYLVDAFSMTLSSATTPNVQIGGGSLGGPTTLFTLDRAASAPIAADNDALLGSMYYDTTLGKLQCYEADGWGACGSSPDNIITISPEYTNAVLHGTGVGTMTSDLCSDALDINDGTSSQPTICGTNETYNFYKWTSPQATAQTYSIYVTYQLPTTFKAFQSGETSLMGRTDSSNSTVAYQIYRNSASGLTACGSSISVSTGSQTSWQVKTATGSSDPSTCGFSGGDSIVFKIDMTASQNANAYVSNLNFTFSNR